MMITLKAILFSKSKNEKKQIKQLHKYLTKVKQKQKGKKICMFSKTFFVTIRIVIIINY